ncbi:hypothetical protein [Enterovirga aerilata]|uniref:Uncharacterized protein n=1 Tax=Enterovirga aerilata TaxID=2730920 RepID=A0A849HWP0_9HYPH|nr:hypothetical protein [Enterovirga sp. DB1703]NNM71522.1 hypothetical protein [Enterovirga sp. DB1703]
MAETSLVVATYLAGLPDSAWSDLHDLAGDVLGRFPGLSRAELERGIAISLEIARARTAETRTPRQDEILQALADSGAAGAAALIGGGWASHAARPGLVPREA